jgi:hypothetical protein
MKIVYKSLIKELLWVETTRKARKVKQERGETQARSGIE